MKSPGCGPMAAIIIIVFILLCVGSNEAVGLYFGKCADEDILDCLMSADEEPEPEGTVTATGIYTYKDYSITVTMAVPLNGGAVTGTLSGTCEGKVSGNYSGNGPISGSMSGVCAPFFINVPASAEWSGTVSESAKTIPVSFNGQGAGIKHEGSLTLTYP